MPHTVNFERKFSGNYYKNLKLNLAEMRFTNYPLKTARGDIYPILFSNGEYEELLENNKYYFKPQGNASVTHLLGRLNPYSTYEVMIDKLADGASVGVYISIEKKLFLIAKRCGATLDICYKLGEECVKLGDCDYRDGMSVLFTLHRGMYIESYSKVNEVIKHIGDAKVDELECLIEEKVFSSTDAALYIEAEGECSVNALLNYLDSGIMQADVKPVKYENGEVLVEDGKIFLTYSSRFETACMQQIISYKLSTCELELVGALLFDSGDGKWCADVATSLMYDRPASTWRLWVCVFSHGHRFAYAETKHDLRFGINVVDVKPVEWVEDHMMFGGKQGDEDPDFTHNEKDGKWYLSICRLDPEYNKYRYYLFKSDRPDGGFSFVARTEDSIETTGGSFVRFNNQLYFCFGRAFGERAKYDVCSFPDMKKLGELQCNHDDGGFRGWGSVFEIPCGTRKRLLWVTFDRTLGSSYNWSYGNFYFYESPTMK